MQLEKGTGMLSTGGRTTHQKRAPSQSARPCGGTVKREVDARPDRSRRTHVSSRSRFLMFRSRHVSPINMQDGAPRECAMTFGRMVNVEGTGKTSASAYPKRSESMSMSAAAPTQVLASFTTDL